MANKKPSLQPLTRESLATYNQEVLVPPLEKILTPKQEFSNFRNRTLTNQDKMLKKLDILLTEKKVREYQEEKEKKL